jgi:hypothetical protein
MIRSQSVVQDNKSISLLGLKQPAYPVLSISDKLRQEIPSVATPCHDRDSAATGLTYQDIKGMPDSQFLALFEKQRNKKSVKYEEISELFPYFVAEVKRTGFVTTGGTRISKPSQCWGLRGTK